ncbi:MAG TPA: hypothetical protein H9693_03990 [Firmicutes bacterium]|nr:hypothetical protein [Bacillota bacterium]
MTAIEHFLEKLVDLLTETAPTESGNYWHLLTKLIIFFIASVLWKEDRRIAIRWNGSGNNLGYPQSRGRATWFILPQKVALAFALSIGNAEMAQIIKASASAPLV